MPLLPDQLRKWNVEADKRHCHEGSGEAAEDPAQVAACPAGSGERWRGLVVAPECRCTPYDREDYDYPQSVEPQIAARLGGMVSPYDGTRFESLKESDIEHIIATSEAHDSRLCAASREVRACFARGLDNLTLATPRLNRYEKVAHDAADWLPEFNRCWFVRTVVAVRQEYGLTNRPARGRRSGSRAGRVRMNDPSNEDRWRGERDFLAASNAGDWHYAEGDAWRERRDAARRGIARRG